MTALSLEISQPRKWVEPTASISAEDMSAITNDDVVRASLVWLLRRDKTDMDFGAEFYEDLTGYMHDLASFSHGLCDMLLNACENSLQDEDFTRG
jgi:hypothetical protein